MNLLASLSGWLGKNSGPGSDGFNRLLVEHAGLGMLKQIVLAQRVPGDITQCDCDMDRGLLILGDGFKARPQMIGSGSAEKNSWLWPWANRLLGPPLKYQQDVLQLKALGEEQGIPEFTSKELQFGSRLQAEHLALIAAGICGRHGLVRTSSTLVYGTVHSWFTLSDVLPLTAAECHAGNLVAAIRRAAACCPVNQRRMVEHFFSQLELAAQPEPEALVASLPEGGTLRLSFDRKERISAISLDGQSVPVAAPQ
ncbi:DUF6882 domain-containing protein [Chitinilyticum aquatile]|uniref:DUF6882 domain-containing protein n=1 Tax=Chitinilyticum aquatile TaxID=362520 RepID=UPI000409D0B6|nr:DUF6882 domain-containing protein [Chitinilyticum aquatile]